MLSRTEQIRMPEKYETRRSVQHESFLKAVLDGLSADRKYLSSKYFYDGEGDRIFQQIMACPEYYLTRCEMQILLDHSGEIAGAVIQQGTAFDVVELGAGDASKSVHLLRGMMAAGAELTYYPVDISGHVIQDLESRLPQELPGLDVQGLCGEYLPMMRACNERSQRRKVILFMGANIGNMLPAEAAGFCRELRAEMGDDDILIPGFDLVKAPQKILAAYNDAGGFTRAFNLNLLRRINDELDADFDLSAFTHYPTYDPANGACKSYLVSMKAQTVCLENVHRFSFAEGEVIYTEISQKYTVAETDALAAAAGFASAQHILDATGGFLVAVWKCRKH